MLSPACTSMGNARAPSRCHLRWHACAISYDSESAPCKLLDDFGFSLLEAPNLKLRTRANGFFWFRKHLHRLKCNRERCTRPLEFIRRCQGGFNPNGEWHNIQLEVTSPLQVAQALAA